MGLLLLVAMPLCFTLFTFVKQQFIRHQRIQRFKTEIQKTITVKADKVNWIEYGEEIEVDGNMFDVESFKTDGPDLVLKGFYDQKEHNLIKQLDEIEQQKSKSGSPLSQLAVKFLLIPSYNEPNTFSIQNNWQAVVSRFPVYTESLSDIVYPAIAPPPKYC